MKYYYAIFKQVGNTVHVEFPQLEDCITLGHTWEDAYEQAEEVLAEWLTKANLNCTPVPPPAPHDSFNIADGELVPVPIRGGMFLMRDPRYGAQGFLLKGLRIKENLTQTEFAKRLGISASKVSRIETGWVNIDESLVYQLEAVFGIDHRVVLYQLSRMT